VRKRARSFLYAGAGIGYMVRHEQSCLLHAAATVAVVAWGWWLEISREDWRWIAAALAAVWSAEAFNTAVEKTCDALSPQFNVHVRAAKDTAAGAVLLVSIGAAVTGLLTLWPYLASASSLQALPVFDIPMCRTGS
jgi:diacylglycerol kinase (ATP)